MFMQNHAKVCLRNHVLTMHVQHVLIFLNIESFSEIEKHSSVLVCTYIYVLFFSVALL